MTTHAFVHVQRSGVSVTLPASASEWAAWDARFAAARPGSAGWTAPPSAVTSDPHPLT